MTDLTRKLDRLTARWTLDGVTMVPGAVLDEIQSTEERLGVDPPAELQQFFLTVNGMVDGEYHPRRCGERRGLPTWSEPTRRVSRNARAAIPRAAFRTCDPPSRELPLAGRERLITDARASP